MFENYSNNVVPGDGPIPAKVMIIGEAPGETEDNERKPFVGKAGLRLNEALEAAGLDRSECYVTNVVKRRPPGNRKPTHEEVDQMWYELLGEMAQVEPEYILLLGNTSLYCLTGFEGISKSRGRISNVSPPLPCVIYATFHPSATFRSRETKETFFKDVAVFAKIIQGSYTASPQAAE